MYSVLRFMGTDDHMLRRIGAHLNSLMPETFRGMDRQPHRFSCVVYDGEGWSAHRDAIVAFMKAMSDHMGGWQREGVRMQLDVMIEPPDYVQRGRYCLSVLVDSALMMLLTQNSVDLVLSFYVAADG
jgi:hypothetical protein